MPFLSLIAAWPRAFGGLIVALALIAALMINNSHQRNIGADKVLVASKENGAKANAKNKTVREHAERPGAAERLLADSCRDCGR